MKTIYAFFAADRYWPVRPDLEAAYTDLTTALNCADSAVLITDDSSDVLPDGDCLVAVPMSGAVQKKILAAASRFDSMVLYGAYIRGNASPASCQQMLRANAAPTLMDTWGVLHRTKSRVMLALDAAELSDKLAVLNAYYHVHGATVLKIGETEPWVVSNASDTDAYEKRFGLHIIKVSQEELASVFENTSEADASEYYDWFTSNSQSSVEPTDKDVRTASRMAHALITVMNKYHADAAAIACFNLLKTGTNTCLGVSYVNDNTDMVVSCECDMDSAVTMLMMKKLTNYKLWMANPGIQPDRTINFSHCTGPIHCLGKASPCILRNHHESGIGVSLQIDYPTDQVVTACRISNEVQDITIHKAVTLAGPYETACRTQMHVSFDDIEHYLRTALGCHQVFAFEDITGRLRTLAELFGLNIL